MTQQRFEAHIKHYLEAQGKFERTILTLTENVAILEDMVKQLCARVKMIEKNNTHSTVSGPLSGPRPNGLPASFKK